MTAEAYIAVVLLVAVVMFLSGYALGYRNAHDLFRVRIDRMRRYYVGGMRDW
jgi:hypothetical protein